MRLANAVREMNVGIHLLMMFPRKSFEMILTIFSRIEQFMAVKHSK